MLLTLGARMMTVQVGLRLSPSQLIIMQTLSTLSTQNKLFGNENKANDHTQQFFQDKNKVLPICLQGNYRDSLHRKNPTSVRHQCAQCCDSENEHSVVTAVEATVLR